MQTELPAPLERYFRAQNSHDLDGMASAFAPDAEVSDEGQTHRGRNAIHEWKRETSAKYKVSVEPMHVEQNAEALVVTARVSGNFPGSPADFRYRFRLDDEGQIRTLEIG